MKSSQLWINNGSFHCASYRWHNVSPILLLERLSRLNENTAECAILAQWQDLPLDIDRRAHLGRNGVLSAREWPSRFCHDQKKESHNVDTVSPSRMAEYSGPDSLTLFKRSRLTTQYAFVLSIRRAASLLGMRSR